MLIQSVEIQIALGWCHFYPLANSHSEVMHGWFCFKLKEEAKLHLLEPKSFANKGLAHASFQQGTLPNTSVEQGL